jgi:DNA repair exonuclease SbcCD ATPase subunit
MRLYISAPGVLLLLAASVQLVDAQSLGEIARMEEARRKAISDAKVYTNDDLPAVPDPAPAAAGAPQQPAADAEPASSPEDAQSEAAASTDSSDAAPRDQAYWSGRMTDLEAALQRTSTLLQALQSRINALTADFAGRDDPAQRAVLAEERQRAVEEFDRLTKQLESDREAIRDLQEEARRASVPPGWLR